MRLGERPRAERWEGFSEKKTKMIFLKYRPDSKFTFFVIIKYNSGFHTQNIKTYLLFLLDKLNCGLVSRKIEGFFSKNVQRQMSTMMLSMLRYLWNRVSFNSFL